MRKREPTAAVAGKNLEHRNSIEILFPQGLLKYPDCQDIEG